MALEFSDGFESGDGSAWTGGGGTRAYSDVNPITGTYSMTVIPTASYGYVRHAMTGNCLTAVCNFQVVSAPDSDCIIFGSTGSEWYVKLTTDRYLDLYENGNKRVDGTTQLATSTTYEITIVVDSTVGYLYIDGASEGNFDGTEANIVTAGSSVYVGIPSGSITASLKFDDVSLYTSVEHPSSTPTTFKASSPAKVFKVASPAKVFKV